MVAAVGTRGIFSSNDWSNCTALARGAWAGQPAREQFCGPRLRPAPAERGCGETACRHRRPTRTSAARAHFFPRESVTRATSASGQWEWNTRQAARVRRAVGGAACRFCRRRNVRRPAVRPSGRRPPCCGSDPPRVWQAIRRCRLFSFIAHGGWGKCSSSRRDVRSLGRPRGRDWREWANFAAAGDAENEAGTSPASPERSRRRRASHAVEASRRETRPIEPPKPTCPWAKPGPASGRLSHNSTGEAM